MNPALQGKIFRSEQVQYGLSANFPVKLDFLSGARNMTAPEVRKISWILTGTMDTTGGGGTTALGADAAKLFARCNFFDEAEVLNASGAMMRLLRQGELGSKAVDPGDVASAVNAAYEYRHELILEPLDTHACRPQDFRIPLEHFLEGGQLSWSTPAAVPTGFGPVNADWRVRVEMEVVDARVKELKARRRIWEQVVQNQDFEYSANGSIRHAILGSTLTTTGYTSLAAFTTLFSRTMDLPPAYQVSGLREKYRMAQDAIGSNDNFLAATPTAIPLVHPLRYQRTGRMIDAKTFHLDLLQAAPASGRLLLDMVVDRTPNLSALVMGYPNAGELAQAIKQHGEIVGEGSNYPVIGSNLVLAKRLPIRLKAKRAA